MPKVSLKYTPLYAPEDKEFFYENGIAGFILGLFLNGHQYGTFHSYLVVDEYEGGQMNDAYLRVSAQGKGYGKLMLLAAIELSHDLLGSYASDSRDVSTKQLLVYDSLQKNGLIECSGIGGFGRMLAQGCKLTDKGRRYLETGLGLHEGALDERELTAYIERGRVAYPIT